MHELGITQSMVEQLSERMRKLPGKRVTRVVIEIGKLTAVLPDSVRFCFDLCCEGTPLEGASLEIEEMPAVGDCRDCGRRVIADDAFALCECGGFDLSWLSGKELRIREMEVEECALPAAVRPALA